MWLDFNSSQGYNFKSFMQDSMWLYLIKLKHDIQYTIHSFLYFYSLLPNVYRSLEFGKYLPIFPFMPINVLNDIFLSLICGDPGEKKFCSAVILLSVSLVEFDKFPCTLKHESQYSLLCFNYI